MTGKASPVQCEQALGRRPARFGGCSFRPIARTVLPLLLASLVVGCSKAKVSSTRKVYPDFATETFTPVTAYDKDHGATASLEIPKRFHVVPLPPNATITESIFQTRMISNSGESLNVAINGDDQSKPSMFEESVQANYSKVLKSKNGGDECIVVLGGSPQKKLTNAKLQGPESNLWGNFLWEKGKVLVIVDYHGLSSPYYIERELERIGNSIRIKHK